MPRTFRLAYVELATPSIDRALGYYRDILGATMVERTGDAAYLSLGLDHHNIALRAAPRAGLPAIGLQLSPDADPDRLERRLTGMGLSVTRKHDARPGVASLIEVEVGGHTFHLLPDMAAAASGFGDRGIEPIRMGHVAILSPDAARTVAFLVDGLGFSTTDWFETLVTFVTCNRDHHVLNVIEAPFATMHHLAFQLAGRDHQFRAADRLARNSVPTLWGPARHTAGHNVASYHHGADGALIELYNDMDVFVPELGYCEPRPWHGDLPQAPKALADLGDEPLGDALRIRPCHGRPRRAADWFRSGLDRRCVAANGPARADGLCHASSAVRWSLIARKVTQRRY